MKNVPLWVWFVVGFLVIGGGGVAVAKLTRGLRNNNPGNIREGKGDSTFWVGERATDDDASFEEFTTMPYGVRAATVLFRNYQSIYGLDSIARLIGRWAPPNENNTAAYIAHISARTGIPPRAYINLRGPAIYPFLRAVFREENGPVADTFISEEDIRKGVALAA